MVCACWVGSNTCVCDDFLSLWPLWPFQKPFKEYVYFLEFLGSSKNKAWIWFSKQRTGGGDRDVANILNTLNSQMGMRGLRVQYGKIKKIAKGVTSKPASQTYFQHEEWGNITVEQYFDWKYGHLDLSKKNHFLLFGVLKKVQGLVFHGVSLGLITVTSQGQKLKYPHLPCLQWGNVAVPMELVTVLGGEHNLQAGKQRAEYQAALSRMTMRPNDRMKGILSSLAIRFFLQMLRWQVFQIPPFTWK